MCEYDHFHSRSGQGSDFCLLPHLRFALLGGEQVGSQGEGQWQLPSALPCPASSRPADLGGRRQEPRSSGQAG